MDNILDFLKNIKLPKLQKLPVGRIIFWAVIVIAAVFVFSFMREFTACWAVTSLPGIPPSSCADAQSSVLSTPALNLKGTPEATLPPPAVDAPSVQAPSWDGGSRINIAFFGLRSGGEPISNPDCPACTDTIIVVSVDPVTKTAAMLSVPRDLFVNIPGFGYSRINTAWTDGEGAKLPGGGPGLAMKTVSQVVGVPIQYYANVDFNTFISAINTIGGVDVFVHQTLVLDPTGTGLDHVKVTCCGMRHLDGKVALAYARTRDVSQGATNGDFGRAQRQQQVILAVRNKVFSPEYFPTFITKAPELYREFASGIHTNLTLDDGIKLAYLLKDIPVDQIKSGVIDQTMTIPTSVTLGGQAASVLIPIPDKIRAMVDDLFQTGGAISPMAQGDPVSLMKADNARVAVLNGTHTAQLDTRTGNYLLSLGVPVVAVGNAPTGYSQTTIIVYKPKLYTLRFLISQLGITSNNQIIFKNDPSSTVDIAVMLGTNWVSKLPAGY
ncbi:MAG: LCP family protein [Chloroflexi bacterium]|nr:LCP family protein [Chloroflexota bacterium]